MSYKSLEVWQLAHELVVAIHRMTLSDLPKFEMYEEGSQIRRSIKSVKSNLVEGYGRRRYKQEFIRFLTYSCASCKETIDHLETLRDTESLQKESLYRVLHEKLTLLMRKMNAFLAAVEISHISVKEEPSAYMTDVCDSSSPLIPYPSSPIPHPPSILPHA